MAGLRSLVAAAALLTSTSAQSVRDVFDCSMRSLAVEYAAWLQPLRSAQVFSDIADALDGTPEKAAGCSVHAGEALRAAMANASATSRFPLLNAPAKLPTAGGQTFYVSLTGSDAFVKSSARGALASHVREKKKSSG